MAPPESISLENTIKNNEISLEIFNVGLSNVGTDTRVDGSKYLYIPEDILQQHFNKKSYRKNGDKEIVNEFMFLYKQKESSVEMILIPTNNYNKLLDISKQTENGEEAKEFIEYFEKQKSIKLKLKPRGYHMEGIPSEFRRIGNQVTFLAKDEPYIHMEMLLNYLI